MKTIAIEAKLRERTGKGGARTARREGLLPGVLYGQDRQIHLSVDRKTFLKALHDAHGENVIFDVKVDGGAPLKSIAREIQHHPITHAAMHVDFQHIDMSKPVHVDVAIHLNGEPEGVRTYGGILEFTMRELEIECLPTNIPASIEVDVSHLMIGDAIHTGDLPSEGFRFVGDPTQVIAQVTPPTVEKVAEEDEEAEAVEGAVPADAAKGDDGE